MHPKYQYATLNHTQNDKHVNNKCLLLHDFWLPLALFGAQFHTPCRMSVTNFTYDLKQQFLHQLLTDLAEIFGSAPKMDKKKRFFEIFDTCGEFYI